MTDIAQRNKMTPEQLQELLVKTTSTRKLCSIS